MRTLQAYHSIRASLISLSKIIGIEIWTSDDLFQPASHYVMILLLIYNICNVYTVVIRATDPVKFMQITVLYGIATLLGFKFFYMIFKKYTIREMFDLVEENIYLRYSNVAEAENLIIKKTMFYLEIIWKAMAVTYFSTFFVFGLWPVFVYFTEGQLVTLFMYEIPLVDTETFFGYLLTLLFQVNLYVIGVLGAIMTDYIFIFVVAHAVICVDIFILHVSELQRFERAETSDIDIEEIDDKWKCCMQDHQLATSFLNAVEDFSGLLCLVQVICAMYTLCDAMLLVSLTDWYAAFCFLIVVFGVISFHFIIGHLVELKVEAMYNSITDLPWNMLSVSQQKEYSFLLARSQGPLSLTLYGFTPLNLDTYTTVVKALYQFFIMVIQYME